MKPSWRPESDFIRRVREEAGYTGWFTFQDLTGFYPALAFGLLLHTLPTYEEIKPYIENCWKPKVADMHRVTVSYSCNWANEECWRELSTICKSQCSSLFRYDNPALSEYIQNNNVCPFSDKSVYLRIAKHYGISLLVYEDNGQGFDMTEYCAAVENEVTFYVCLAVEAGKISVLVHGLFDRSEVVASEGFPFYVKYAGKVNIHRGCGSENALEQTQPVIRGMSKMIDLLALLTLSRTGDFPSHMQPAITTLQSLHTTIAKQHGFQWDFNSENLASVLSIPIHSEPVVDYRPAHTIRTCSLYPEYGDLVSDHGHRFHLSCLEVYLTDCFNRGDWDLLCPKCSTISLPVIFLDFFPSLQNQFYESKERTSRVSKVLQPGLCHHCDQKHREVITLDHGHGLCLTCATLGSSFCRSCGHCLSLNDKATIQHFARQSVNM